VLTVLPYQLGFHPHDCLVVVSLRGSRMGLVQRIDLPAPEHVGDAVAAMLTPLLQDGPGAVLLIGFEEGEGASRAMLDAMAGVCVAHGVRVADRMVVRDRRSIWTASGAAVRPRVCRCRLRARFPRLRSSSDVRSARCPTARRLQTCWSRTGR
jgi:hypothetical protein